MPGSPDLSEFAQYGKQNGCRIRGVLDKLSKEDAEALQAAFDAGITNSSMMGWCRARGVEENLNSAMVSHRARTCSCYAGQSS